MGQVKMEEGLTGNGALAGGEVPPLSTGGAEGQDTPSAPLLSLSL